ncbi:MAG: RNHCP domain-containing protein [Clostridiales bacterium]|nr:RNHCP domain-containing protein [Clostridiales bacterium]
MNLLKEENHLNSKKKQRGQKEPREAYFVCQACGAVIAQEGAGSRHRNHCPKCLASLHLDEQPGDRASLCKGVMDAIGVWVRKDGEWAILHRCRKCGAIHSNRIAADDNPIKLVSIALKPLASPPFPLELLEQMAAIENNQRD